MSRRPKRQGLFHGYWFTLPEWSPQAYPTSRSVDNPRGPLHSGNVTSPPVEPVEHGAQGDPATTSLVVSGKESTSRGHETLAGSTGGTRIGRVRRSEIADAYRLWAKHKDIRLGQVRG